MSINHYEFAILRKGILRMQRTELWKDAFKEYNEEAILRGDRPLSMECRSCWIKVLEWHKKKLNIQ
jgi:hypothetical protein